MRHRIPLMTILPAMLTACALNGRPDVTPTRMAQLWEAPADLESRDLLYGPGGRQRAPRADSRFEFVDMKKQGSQPGYDVRDERGRNWSVKLGPEGRVEVAMSRIVWAIGYHQPDVYHLPAWTLVRDGAATTQEGARFRLESEESRKVGEWSWRNNPFLNTRPMIGLFVLMVMMNNWDITTVQNAVYEAGDDEGRPVHRYMVRDLGAALGKTRWPSVFLSTKADPDAFAREPFITRIEGGRVRFRYDGAWREPHLHSSATPDDVRWVCGLLNRLSDRQWRDAFRAGGFNDAEALRYIQRLKEKVAEGLAI